MDPKLGFYFLILRLSMQKTLTEINSFPPVSYEIFFDIFAVYS